MAGEIPPPTKYCEYCSDRYLSWNKNKFCSKECEVNFYKDRLEQDKKRLKELEK